MVPAPQRTLRIASCRRGRRSVFLANHDWAEEARTTMKQWLLALVVLAAVAGPAHLVGPGKGQAQERAAQPPLEGQAPNVLHAFPAGGDLGSVDRSAV